jgi:CPA2 family monovalent cation:H+ antiporter-2
MARSRELFLISTTVLCFAVAWLTAEIGLSLALGAFLAGLIITESEYGHQALDHILPFRDVFTSFFFVSVGMLLNVHILLDEPLLVFGGTVVVLLLKTLVVVLMALVLGYPLHTAVVTGLGLAQVGEFAFVLSRVGVDTGLLSDDNYGIFLAISVMTMVLTPFLIRAGDWSGRRISRLPLPHVLKLGLFAGLLGLERRVEGRQTGLRDHLIIAGYGVNGRNVARAAKAAEIKYLVEETNPDTVRRERSNGEPIFYGDVSSEEVLGHAGAKFARTLVVTIPDMATVRKVVAHAREINPGLHIIARTRFVSEMALLYELGANEVIPEEFETSVEIFTRVLRHYLVPSVEIERFVAEVRADSYGLFRKEGAGELPVLGRQLGDVEISPLAVDKGADLDGGTLVALDMRRQQGATVLAVRRAGEMLTNPDGDFMLTGGDEIVVLCAAERLPELIVRCRLASPREE